MRISHFFPYILGVAILTGCTTVPEKPANNWAVRVKDAELVGNNAYTPKQKDQATERVSAPELAAAPVPTPVPDRMWVWHADGSKQCDKKKGIDPERLAGAVKKRGIHVFEFRSSHDDLRHPMLCGTITGRTVELEISSKDLPKAHKLGLLEKSTAN